MSLESALFNVSLVVGVLSGFVAMFGFIVFSIRRHPSTLLNEDPTFWDTLRKFLIAVSVLPVLIIGIAPIIKQISIAIRPNWSAFLVGFLLGLPVPLVVFKMARTGKTPQIEEPFRRKSRKKR